jgi:hypothetical protein
MAKTQQTDIPGLPPRPQQPPQTKKVPRQIRRALERKLNKMQDELLTRWGMIQLEHQDPTDHTKKNTVPMIDLKTWDPEWMTDKGGDWEDPLTKQKKKIRISEMKTFGRAGSNTKSIRVSRKKYTKFVTECQELMDECDPNGIIAQEALGDFGDVSDNQVGLWNSVATQGAGAANGKYLPYQPGPYTRQIYTPDMWVMLARAAELEHYNPLAKAGIYVKTAFTIGKGPKILIAPPTPDDGAVPANGVQVENKAQDAWDDYAERVKFATKLANRDRMLSTNGEFFLEACWTRDGQPITKSIDPGTVYDIVAEPRDIDQVYGLVLMYPTRYQTFTQGAKGERVNVSEFVFETIPPDNVTHLKVNVQENEMRGRSDLLPVMNICDWFMDYLKFKVLQAWVIAAFAWDVTLNNAEQADVDSFSRNINAAPPAPMTINVHNDQVKFEPMQANASQGGTKSGIFEEIVTAFCCGILVPTEYVGLSTTGNRATSITKTEPSIKVFSERRQVWEPAIKREVQFVVRQETGDDVDEADIEISWDEIAPENITERITNLIVGLVNKSITKKRFDTMYAKLLDINSYNWEKEQEDILDEIMKDPMIVKAKAAIPTKPPFANPIPTAAPAPAPAAAGAAGKPAPPKPKTPPNPSGDAGVREIKKQHQRL